MVPFSGAGGVLVGPDDRGIHDHLPVDRPDRVGLGLGMGQQSPPGAIGLPAPEPLIAGLPGPIALGQVPPGHPGESFHKIPLTTRRWLAHWPPGRPLAGSSGAISAQA